MEKKTKKFNLFNIFAQNQTDMVSLGSLSKGKDELIRDYLTKFNRMALKIGAFLLVLLNAYWLIAGFIQRNTDIYSTLGMSILLVIGLLIPIYMSSSDSQNKTFSYLVLGYHLCITASVLLLAVSRGFLIYENGVDASVCGLPLSVYWLAICSFTPLFTMAHSIISMAFILICSVMPVFICPAGSYFLIGNHIIALCTVFAYFALRAVNLKSANLVAELAYTSYKDYQTGALNRRAVKEYFESLSQSKTERLAVMMYDIDDFKSYKSANSHESGDKALAQINKAVDSMLIEEGARVFRYGGGSFVAIMEDITNEKLLKTALKVKDSIEALKIERKDNEIRKYITVTVGCAAAEGKSVCDMNIVSEADTQMDIGKNGTKNCVVFKGRIYVSEGEITLEQQPTLYTEKVYQAIETAMKNGEIKAYYQPMYETATHKLVGAEALCRWIKPDGTVIMPSEFVFELEKNSSILALDWYMYEEVCKFLKYQKDNGIPQVRISINFSRMHVLYERSIEKRLSKIADSYQIPHSLIEIEVTESAYIRLPDVIEPFIREIRAQGFAVAVDDFGSGVSSLEFIKNVDVDTLKIDKSLISSNCSDEKERVLLESVVFLAHRLQLTSVAEGVETPEQLGFLTTLGCNQIQGFIFSVPLPEADFIEICRHEADKTSDFDIDFRHNIPSSMSMLIDTVFKRYPIVIMSNISKNSYYTMTYESLTNHRYVRSGKITDLLDEIESTLNPADIKLFRETFNFKHQIACFENGEEKTFFNARIHGDDDPEKFRSIETTSYYIKENGSDDLLVVTFCSETL